MFMRKGSAGMAGGVKVTMVSQGVLSVVPRAEQLSPPEKMVFEVV